MKYYLLSDNVDTKIGMRLAGVEGKVVHGKEEFLNAFEEAVKDKDIAVLLITEKLASLDPFHIEKQKSLCRTPLIVELPDRHGSSRAQNYILKYIKDAIGVNI